MNGRDGLHNWSVSCGTWFQTQVRVSVFLLLFIPTIMLRLGLSEWKLGLAINGLLFVSVLLHEFGHIFAARFSGGSGNEILLWPLGGLAYVHPAETFRSQFLIPAAGPLVNLALCGISFRWVWLAGNSAAFWQSLNPLELPIATLNVADHLLVAHLMILLFWLNWLQFLINLLPVFPLDGGRMLQACLATRIGAEGALELSLRVGLIAAGVSAVVGLVLDHTMLLFLGAMLFIMNIVETMQARSADGYDESFMGYDFSQGYTSLERSRETKPPRRPGFVENWRARRRAEKERRAQLRAEQEQQLIDALLEKVHTQGMASLTDSERRTLDRASAKLRDKGKQGQ